MLVEGIQRSIAVSDCIDAGIPDQQQVIVSSASEVFSIRGPPEPTHFLGVSGKSSNMVICHSDIMVVYRSVSAPAEE